MRAVEEGDDRAGTVRQAQAQRHLRQQELAAQRRENCGRARGHASALESGQRIARTNEKGEREILDDLRDLGSPPVGIVVNTHGHFDHAYGNALFRPAMIWGQAGCVPFMRRTGNRRKSEIAREEPDLAPHLDEIAIDPPDRTFADRAAPAVTWQPAMPGAAVAAVKGPWEVEFLSGGPGSRDRSTAQASSSRRR